MTARPSEIDFKIHGMDCAEEVTTLERELGPLVGGVDHLAFDILNGKMTIGAGAKDVSLDVILRVVARAGMRAELWRDETEASKEKTLWQRYGRVSLTGASGLLSLAGFLLHAWIAGGFGLALGSEGMGISHQVPFAPRVLFALGVLCGAWYVLPKAWLAARRLRPDMNLLMIIAISGALGIGEWFEASTVSLLFALSLTLESWSVGRARRAVEALLAVTPATVRRIRQDGSQEEILAEQTPVGCLFLVKPGERIPLDGITVRGISHVNQAPITGESLPVLKQAGDQVFAGTINGDGALEVESTKSAKDTTLAHIIRMVEQAQARRAPSEQWVERFAHIYTPTVFAAAFFVALIPPLLLSGAWSDWFYRSLVLLVIGCPCALVISTPVSIVASLAAAARNGVLVKGGAYMEAPARLKAIAFDKTGTLTQGKPAVVEVVPMSGHDETELLEIALSMERQSNHPLAQAIVAFAQQKGVQAAQPEDFQIVQGKGATARLNGKSYWLGSHRFLEERKQEIPEVHHRLDALSQSGRTVVVVGDDIHVCGFIALADSVRPEARQAIQAVRRAGVDHVIMLTGDNAGTAQAVAGELGVDDVRAELLPGDKVAAVEAAVAKYDRVAMVGDGINDAPAMVGATLGIAMGAAGSDAAIEAADVALMSDDLMKLPWLIHHSKRTLRIIHQNIGLSLSVKALFVALTFLGYASLWTAIAADMGVSLLVIFNALRLLRPARCDSSHDQVSDSCSEYPSRGSLLRLGVGGN